MPPALTVTPIGDVPDRILNEIKWGDTPITYTAPFQNDGPRLGVNDLSGLGVNDLSGLDANGQSGLHGNDHSGLHANDLSGLDANDLSGLLSNDLSGLGTNNLSGLHTNDQSELDTSVDNSNADEGPSNDSIAVSSLLASSNDTFLNFGAPTPLIAATNSSIGSNSGAAPAQVQHASEGWQTAPLIGAAPAQVPQASEGAQTTPFAMLPQDQQASAGTQTTPSSGTMQVLSQQASSGMQINVTFDQSVSSLPAGFVSAVNYVVNYFDSLFTNNVTINIDVGYGEVAGSALASNALGSSVTNYLSESYSSTKSALLGQNAPGASTLPSTSPLGGTLFEAQAEAKALGLTSTTSLDGYVGFSNAVAWDYTTAAPSAGQYYLIGTIEHEITEVLGRQSFLNMQPNFYTPMDLFRYTSPGVRDLTTGGSGSTAYFSIDNGVTNLGTWNNNPNNGDLGDWYPSGPAPGGTDAANDYSSSGVINVFSATDITNMQALGWTVTSGSGPAAPTIASFTPDTGVVGDSITKATVLTLKGSATASSTVNVYDGATLLGTAAVDASGAWSFATGTLSNGTHSFTATDTVSGTTSAASSALNVTVDTVAPVAPNIASFSPDTGVVGDQITNVNTLTLTGTAEANSTVKVYDGATLLGNAVTNGSGAWTYTTAALSDGAHNLTATATDAAGNISTASSALSVTVDTVAPAVTESLVNDTLTGSGDANAVVNFTIDGTAVSATATADSSGAWAFMPSGLASGTHTIVASETDVAGNTGSASLTFTLITTTTPVVAPAAPSVVSFSPDTGTVGDGITNANVLTLAGTAEANSTVTVYDGATLLGTSTANSTGAWTYATAALSSSIHSFTATDTVSGTTSAPSAALSVTVDTVTPAVRESLVNDTGSSANDNITSNDTLAGSGDPNAVVHFTIDGTPVAGTVTANASGAWTFTPTGLANGSHTITASETDIAGNTSSSSLTFTLDTTAPAVTETLTNNKLTGSGDPNALVHFTVDGKATTATATATATGAWNFTPSGLSSGNHTIVATETDVAGNTGSASLIVTVNSHHHMVAATTTTAMLGQNNSVSSLPSSPSVHAVVQNGFATTGSEHFVFIGEHNSATPAQLQEMTTPSYLPNYSNNNGDTPLMNDGTHADNSALLSNYLASSFATASDAHGATAITNAMPIIAAHTAFLTQPMQEHFLL